MQLKSSTRLLAANGFDDSKYKELFDTVYKVIRRFGYKTVGYVSANNNGYRFIRFRGVAPETFNRIVDAISSAVSKYGYKLHVENEEKFGMSYKYGEYTWFREDAIDSIPQAVICISEDYNINHSMLLFDVYDGISFYTYKTPYLKGR